MRNDLKLLVYVAAGVGAYTILKRYGILNDVGRWLSDQVPEDYKRQAAHAYSEARQRVGEASGYVKDQAGKVGDQVKSRVQDMRGGAEGEQEQSSGSGEGHPGQNISGKVESTTGSDGSSAVHRVGRGVMH